MCISIQKIDCRFFLLALASCVTKGSSGQYSGDRPFFHLGCLALKAILKESFFFMVINWFRKLVPFFGFWWGVEPFCWIVTFLCQSSSKALCFFPTRCRSFDRSVCWQFSIKFHSNPNCRRNFFDIMTMCITISFLSENFAELNSIRIIGIRKLKMKFLQKI